VPEGGAPREASPDDGSHRSLSEEE